MMQFIFVSCYRFEYFAGGCPFRWVLHQYKKDPHMEDFGPSSALCILTQGTVLSLTLGIWWRSSPFFRHVEVTDLGARLGHTAVISDLRNGATGVVQALCPESQSLLEAEREPAHSYLDFHLGALALPSSCSSGRGCWTNGVISPCVSLHPSF